jgi:hypothetical protein
MKGPQFALAVRAAARFLMSNERPASQTVDGLDRKVKACEGCFIFTIAGSLWSAYGARSSATGQSFVMGLGIILLVALVAIGLWIQASRRLKLWQSAYGRVSSGAGVVVDSTRQEAAKKKFIWINVAQGIAIFLAVQVWTNLHQRSYLAPTVCIIVGLHFIALAPVYRTRTHAIIGALQCLLGIVVAGLIAQNGPVDEPASVLWGSLIGFGSAAILWGETVRRLFLDPELQPTQGER